MRKACLKVCLPHGLFNVLHHSTPPNETVHLATNLNKLDKTHYDLINTLLHKNWDILALQEPYIDALDNNKANSQWHVVYPTRHLANNTIDRSVLLINVALDFNRWVQILVEDSNDFEAIQLHTPKGHITIFNLCRLQPFRGPGGHMSNHSQQQTAYPRTSV